jgi:lysyl oxidase
LTLALGCAGVLLGSMTGTALAADHLFPDLKTLKPRELRVSMTSGKAHLRFSNTIANKGRGPLEAFPSAASTGCDNDADSDNDRDAFQRVFKDSNDNNIFERGVDTESSETKVGCFQFHDAPGHNHWHFLDFAEYRLLDQPSGNEVRQGRKVGFCLVDNQRRYPSLLGSPEDNFYPQVNGLPSGCSADEPSMLEGLSVGWADSYSYALPGQSLNVNGLPAGRYCLASAADPDNKFAESNDSNNARRIKIRLNPEELDVKVLDARCSSA